MELDSEAMGAPACHPQALLSGVCEGRGCLCVSRGRLLEREGPLGRASVSPDGGAPDFAWAVGCLPR